MMMKRRRRDILFLEFTDDTYGFTDFIHYLVAFVVLLLGTRIPLTYYRLFSF